MIEVSVPTYEFICHIVNSKQFRVNYHYFNRYIKFYSICMELNVNNYSDNLIKHHFLPKAKDAFPEYSSFSKYPWNKLKLTKRQHIFAHLLLYKSFPKLKSQIYALNQLKGLIDNKLPAKILYNLKLDLTNCLSEDIVKKQLKRKTKCVYNKNSKQYYRIPIDQKLLSCELLKNKPMLPKPDYLQKYHNPKTNKEYWVDVRYSVDPSLVRGRSPNLKKLVQITSKGNASNINKFKYYHPQTLKEYNLCFGDNLIQELKLIKGRSPKSNLKNKETCELFGLNRGDKNPMFGSIRSDMWPIILIIDKNGNQFEVKQPAKLQYQQYPKRLRNIGIITDDILRKLFPRKYKKYTYLIGNSIIYNGFNAKKEKI